MILYWYILNYIKLNYIVINYIILLFVLFCYTSSKKSFLSYWKCEIEMFFLPKLRPIRTWRQLKIRKRWCHSVTRILEAMMSCRDMPWIVYVLRLLFPPPHAANEIHSASLSLSVSLSLSLSLFFSLSFMFRCLRLSWFHCLTYKHNYALNTQGRQSGGLEGTLQWQIK